MADWRIVVSGDYDTRHIPTEGGEIVYDAPITANDTTFRVDGRGVVLSGDVFDGGCGHVQGGTQTLRINGRGAAHPAPSYCSCEGYYSGVTATLNRVLRVFY